MSTNENICLSECDVYIFRLLWIFKRTQIGSINHVFKQYSDKAKTKAPTYTTTCTSYAVQRRSSLVDHGDLLAVGDVEGDAGCRGNPAVTLPLRSVLPHVEGCTSLNT